MDRADKKTVDEVKTTDAVEEPAIDEVKTDKQKRKEEKRLAKQRKKNEKRQAKEVCGEICRKGKGARRKSKGSR